MDNKNNNSCAGRDQRTFRRSIKDPVGWIQIGANVIAPQFSAIALEYSLDRDNPSGRYALPMEPHRDMRLTDMTTGQFGKLNSKSSLSSGETLDFLSQGADFIRNVNGHTPDNNTMGVINVNTRCVFHLVQTGGMPKKGNTTEFWKRLTEARTTCKPSKSMKQKDIAKDYGAAFQSTVTKWKTGGPTGNTIPESETILRMALDTGVDVNWLWSGRGIARPKVLDEIAQQIVEALDELEEHEKFAYLKEVSAVPAMRRIRASKQATEKAKQSRKESNEVHS